MKKLLHINPVLRTSTSTGRIIQEIGTVAMEAGWDNYIAYSRGRDGVRPCQSKLIPVGSTLSVAWHGLVTRFFDMHGLGSKLATRRFVRESDRLQPDVIHIHNIHGYFLNYKVLFDYLSKADIPVVWTVHDCWLYTGHCYHYASIGCDKWKTGCHNCKQSRTFSWFVDRSRWLYQKKKEAHRAS